MDYAIKLRIDYVYDAPASGGRHVVCVTPLDLGPQQSVSEARLTIMPTPKERTERTDFFGNRVTEFGFRGAHDAVSLTMTAKVRRTGQARAAAPGSLMAALPEELAACQDVGPRSPLHFLAPSIRVQRDPEIIAFARDLLLAGASVEQTMLRIGQALHRHMTFDAKATTVDTSAAEAFAKGRGVCQDYAQIMIGGLRALGIPAAYVSGFLRTLPPPGKPRLEGADAMHAWVRVWCGAGSGWVDYDPTNACAVGADHIVVAQGRDYSDVAPVKGSMRTSGRQKSRQAVDVVPI